MHYGTPLWLENSFINASYPQHVADYAYAVVTRYQSLVRYYTPLNEPMVNADMCGNKAEWPPYLSGDDGYVKLILALAKGILLTMQAIKAAQPDAVTVQVEALWHTFTQDDALAELALKNNTRQYLCFDLTTGRINKEHPLVDFLYQHGVCDSDLDWFYRNAATYDFFGANFYPWSYSELRRAGDGSVNSHTGKTSGDKIALVLRETYERYKIPIIVTETSAAEDITGRTRWMDETLESVRTLRSEGIPVCGYTWFPLFTMVDWAYRKGRGPLNDYLIHLGLYDSTFDAGNILRRHRTPLVEHYQQHIANPMPPITQRS
jgi:beta-glucosidase/6-phospho-beta-glucosidase/beta-galactosidase